MITEVELAQVCDIRSGGTPSRGNKTYYGGKIPWAKIGDLESAETIVKTEEYISEEGLRAIRGRMFPAGTLLFAIYGSMGKMAFAGTELATNQAILGIQPLPDRQIDLRYLYHYLSQRVSDLQADGRGVTQKNLSATYLRELKVPLPRIQEQQRIASILDRADAIRRKRKKGLALADELLKSAFLKKFGDPVANPKHFQVKPLSLLLTGIDSGHSPLCESRPATASQWGVLKVSAVSSTVFLKSENKAVLTGYQPRGDHLVHRNDLLFSRKNTYELVGATAIVEEEVDNLAMPDLIFRLVPNDKELRTPYLWATLTQRSMRERLREIASGAAGSMPNIGKGRLLDLEIPVPNLTLQDEFSRFYSAIRKLKSRLQEDNKQANQLFAALSQQAFSASSREERHATQTNRD